MGSTIRIESSLALMEVAAAADKSFEVVVDLHANAVNHFVVTELFAGGGVSPAVALEVVQDGQPPKLFIDFPADGEVLSAPKTNVSGRVSDVLSGFLGLDVFVNGQPAAVNVGIGTNATFEFQKLPLVAGAPNQIVVRAVDAVGNEVEKEITVQYEAPSGNLVEKLSGDDQSGLVETLLAEPIRVKVRRANGLPFAGKVICFAVTKSDGQLTPNGNGPGKTALSVLSDASGIAEVYWRLGSDAGCGNNRLAVTSKDVSGTVYFCASALAAPPDQVNVGSGSEQVTQVGGPAPEVLRAWVSDGCNGVADVPVTFKVTQGGGLVSGGGMYNQTLVTVTTGPTGHAQVTLIVGPKPGNNRVAATIEGSSTPAVFGVVGVEGGADETRFEGQVLDNSGQPILGATCMLEFSDGTEETTTTSEEGCFEFTDLQSSGLAHLHIDGSTATEVGGPTEGGTVPIDPELLRFPALAYEPVVIAGAVNSLPRPILLPRLDPANDVVYDGLADVELGVEGIDGLRMFVTAGSMTLADGTVPDELGPVTLSLNQVHSDDIPMQPGDGAAPPFAWTLQPAEARFDPPVRVSYPNISGLAPGAVSFFLSFNHSTGRFDIVATGSVNDDGSCIETDPGSGIEVSGWGCNCPPYSVAGSVVVPNVEISGPDTVTAAADAESTFTAAGFPSPGTYAWTGGAAVGSTTGASYKTKFLSSGTVAVTYTCQSGATATDSVKVDVDTPVKVKIDDPAPNPLYTCPSTQVTFKATGSPAGGTWSWSGGTAVSGASTANYTAEFSSAGSVKVKVTYTGPGGTSMDTADLTVEVERPTKVVAFTRSRHPNLASPNDLQSLFDSGAALVKGDDDGPGDGGFDDDVCLDLSFTLTVAAQATFPDQSAGTFPPAEQYDYTLPIYNDIPNSTAKSQLLAATFANLKQVNSGQNGPGKVFTASAKKPGKSIVFTQIAVAATTVHEWGHNAGLGHRPETDDQKPAILYFSNVPGRNEINRDERKKMEAF
ncbi:hypothetical protein [Engelhardtia mirabilis]